MESNALPPFTTHLFYGKFIYNLGDNICIYVDVYLDYPIKLHVCKFLDSADKTRIFPSKDGITLDPTNFEFLFSIFNLKYKNNLIATKDKIMKDYDRSVRVKEKVG